MAAASIPLMIPTPSRVDARPSSSLQSRLTPTPRLNYSSKSGNKLHKSARIITFSSPPFKTVRYPKLDKHVVNQNRIRFVQKLMTLLLSKPKHFMPLHIVCKCRSYLSLHQPRSVISMIRRYPTIFELFTIPRPSLPMNAVGSLSQLCVRLTPAAAALAKRESDLKKHHSTSLAEKLHKLLMLASPYNRLLLSKLAHLGPDLGLPVNFRSRLCNDHPNRFKTVDTSYGRALELVAWDSNLAKVLPSSHDETVSHRLIVDRPLKFKHVRLRKGLNVKRRHHEYLVKFQEVPDVCPYSTNAIDLKKESIEAEKRACAVVREVLGMTVEKRTLVDHLTHFRKEFGLPNKTRGMLVRHPDMFYVSLKGLRDSVFLVEGYNDKGMLVEKDEILSTKDELMELVQQGKRIRREGRKKYIFGDAIGEDARLLDNQIDYEYLDDCEDGLDDLFGIEDWSSDDDVDEDDDGSLEFMAWQQKGEFWVAQEVTWPSESQNDSRGLGPW